MDIDGDEDELSFVPSVVSSLVGWREPRFKCDKRRREEGFHYWEVAVVMVEDGELCTTNLCENCYDLMQDERNEPRFSRLIVEKRS